jgi:hypothetical protein
MDKQIVAHLYNEILFSNKKEWTCMDLKRHNAKLKSDIKKYVPFT